MDALSGLNALLQHMSARLATVEAKVGIQASSAPTSAPPTAVEKSAVSKAYEEYFEAGVKPFLDACKAAGEKGAKIADVIGNAFLLQGKAIEIASKSKKPDLPILQKFVQPVGKTFAEVGALRDRDDFENHVRSFSEGIQALGWLISPGPVPHVQNCFESSDFWANKVRMQFRTRDPKMVTVVDTFKEMLMQLKAYVKQHHTTGLTWNPSGGAVTGDEVSLEAPTASKEKPKEESATSAPTKKAAFLAKLTAKKAPAPAEKKPKMERFRNTWQVEHWKNCDPITLDDVARHEKVYIFGCENTTIFVNGKCNAITLDKCKRVNLLFDTVLSSCEIVNCQRVKAQTRVKAPSFAIDKTDGCVVYLNYASKDCQIVTSKCSEVNISFPETDAEDSDWKELPVPEQFVSTLVDGGASVDTRVSDLYK